MEILLAILSMSIALESSSSASGWSCSVDEKSKSNAPICKAPLDSESVSEYTNQVLNFAGLEKPKQGQSLTCRNDSIEFKDNKGEVVNLVKAKNELPGAVETQIIQRDGEENSRVHILTQDNQLVRFDPQTKKLESVKLPEGFSLPSSNIFSADGRYVLGSAVEGAADEASKLDIDALFEKAHELSRSPTEAAESESNAAVAALSRSDQAKSSPQQASSLPRFQPVNLQNSGNANQDLLVFDNESQGIREFPVLWSRPVDLASKAPIGNSIFISDSGTYAVTVSADGSARLWERPHIISLQTDSADPSVVDASNEGSEALTESKVTLKIRAAGDLGDANKKSGDRALQLVNDILNLNSLVPGTESKVDHREALEAMNARIQSARDAAPRDEAVDVAVAMLSDQVEASMPHQAGFHLEYGILVSDGVQTSSPEKDQATSSEPSRSSADEDSTSSLPGFEWIFLLPERLSVKRRRDFARPV